MTSIIRCFERLFIGVGALALLAMMLHVTADVVFKYVLHSPVPLTMEMVTYYYMAAVVFLPLFSLERKGANLVHVELVYGMLSRRVRRVMLPAALLLAALFCACAGYAAWKPAMQAFKAGTYAGSLVVVPIWPTRFLPVVGFALLAICLMLKAFNAIRHGIDEEDEEDARQSMSLEGNE